MSSAAPATFLGFDHGLRRIGVAVGQNISGTASPLAVLPAHAGQPDWDRVASLIADWRPAALIVGRPRHADDAPAPMTAHAERFARRLHGRFGLPVHCIDEHLSSVAAAALPGPVDAQAARIILENWLEQGAWQNAN